MNLNNIKRIFNHIFYNVPVNKIKMSLFRTGSRKKHECQTVGCIIGHCTILDDYENIPKHQSGEINFKLWSEQFTGLNIDSNEWEWCFGGEWPNNKGQILLRLKYLIDNQSVPNDWDNYNYYLPIKNLEPYELN